MKHKLVRIAIGVPEAFIALSAIGGGIVLLATYLWTAEHRGHHFQIRHT